MHIQDNEFDFAMSILKSNNGNPECCNRYTFTYDKPVAGEGRFIHTYMGDGNPLPSFEGEPTLVDIEGDIDIDYGELEEELEDEGDHPDAPDIVKDGEDYDFDAMSGMLLDKYDEDDGTNIRPDGSDTSEPLIDDDDGFYNFGDIDEGDESVIGDYDFGDLDEGVDDDSMAKEDYDFNKLAGDVEEWVAAGTEFELDNTPMYATYSSTTSFTYKSGLYYVYNSSIVNDRVRMTRTDGGVEMAGRATGWCNIEDLINLGSLVVGDQVRVSGNLYVYANGSGGKINKDGEIMYICEVLDTTQYEFPYALSTGPVSSRIGFASEDNITKVANL
jgi:hypothetical protein